MSARHPQGLLFLFLTIFAFFTLLVTVPHGFAQETMEPQVSSFDGVVSGTCFHDANGNGMLDAAEGGIAGITLSLKAVTSLTRQTEIITTMSNEEGKYEFIGLSRSVYRLEAQNTVQWLCDSQNPQRVVVASFITRKAINVTFQKPVVQDSFVLSEFQFNSMDTLP
jgi:hypothetical protein